MTRRLRQGSVALEAALVMPGLILLLALLLGLIAAPAAETELQVALDHTASELALLAPVADRLSAGWPVEDPDSTDPSVTDDNTGGLDAMLSRVPGWTDLIEDGALDLASSVLLAPLVFQRIDQWLAESGLHQDSFQHLIGSRRLFVDLDARRGDLWLCLDYELQLPGLTLPRQMAAHVPLWTGHGLVLPGDSDRGRIWELDNFSRGQLLRQYYDGNLPYDFPVIARWQSGEACSIKSMDLTAPTYSEPAAVRRRVRQQISRLAGFQGYVYQRGQQQVVVALPEIRSRTLLLIIPENSPASPLAALSALQQEAAVSGISLTIQPHGSSLRYSDGGASGD